MKFLYLIILGSFLSFIIHGCVDENLVPGSENVNVHLYDGNLFGFDQGKISTGNFLIANSDGDGNVSLKNVFAPFTLKLTYVSLYAPSISEIYDYTNCKNVNLIVENVWSGLYGPFITINVQHPFISQGQMGLIKFISKEPFYEEDNIFWFSWGSVNLEYKLYFPINKKEIKGKFIILILNGIGRNLSYENYGEKQVILNRDLVQYVSFSSDDIKYNPPEKEISYQVITPVKYKGLSTGILLSFDDCNLQSDIPIGYFFRQGNIIIPLSLLSGFKIKLYSYIDYGGYNFMEKWAKVNPGEDIILDNSKQPENFTPPDNSINISDTSTFSYDDNFNTGIYYLRFAYTKYDQCYITHKNKITFGELKKAGLSFAPNTLYSWYVEKYSDFTSTDDFFSKPYSLNTNYNSRVFSERRIFRTAP